MPVSVVKLPFLVAPRTKNQLVFDDILSRTNAFTLAQVIDRINNYNKNGLKNLRSAKSKLVTKSDVYSAVVRLKDAGVLEYLDEESDTRRYRLTKKFTYDFYDPSTRKSSKTTKLESAFTPDTIRTDELPGKEVATVARPSGALSDRFHGIVTDALKKLASGLTEEVRAISETATKTIEKLEADIAALQKQVEEAKTDLSSVSTEDLMAEVSRRLK